MFFEATLSSAAPDRQRIQRLCFATLITVGMTTSGLAGSWALEQLGIERVGGPRSTFELVEFSLLAPKPIDPPPPPPRLDTSSDIASGGQVGPKRESIEEQTISNLSSTDIDSTEPSKRIPDIGTSGSGRIPSSTGIGCPAGICGSSLIPSTNGDGCVGPQCGVAKRPDRPPAEVSFSALHCLACSDPDRAELRRTASSLRKQGGNVALRFCVDVHGRVDTSSIDVTDSFGDAEVDRITRAAVSRWRFKPMQIAGEPRRACSETHFRITFD
jgi:TonB family protein